MCMLLVRPTYRGIRRPGDAHTLSSKPCGIPAKAMISPQIRNRILYFHYAFGFTFPMTRIHVRLLGPCYKTGQADHACIRLQSTEQSQSILAPTISLVQHATVARLHIVRTQLVQAIDRV